jgi:TonB-linked SusC/RagA family outer membrane protein
MFGRINYSFRDKYLLAATIRRDGTSRLISDNRWGNFPSVSGAWKISNEPFMSGSSFISDLKLRASYGKLGNVQNLGNYATIAALDNLPGSAAQQIFSGFTFADAVNANVVWEETIKKGIGIDASFFDGKLYTTMEFYLEDTENQIFNRPIALSAGKSGDPSDNGPTVRNSGFDLELGYRISAGNWSYGINVNFSTNKNEVTDLAGEEEAFKTDGIVVGKPVRSFYGYVANGIIQSQSDIDSNPYLKAEENEVTKEPGDIWWEDINGDGIVNADDRTILGSIYPDFTYGFVGDVSYKNIGLQVQLQGVQGVDKDISTQNDFGLFHYFQRWALNHDDEILNRWHTTKNPAGNMPKVDITDKGRNRVRSDFWLYDASYLRISNVNLYYNFPAGMLDKIKMGDLSVYFSIQNLYTFTSFIGNEVEFGEDTYKDIFPDTALPESSDPLVGVPQPRTWTLGLKATF